MVASGLTGTMLDVASYRLATHLGLAFFILGLIAWYIMVLGRPERDLLQARRSGEAGLVTGANWLMGLAAVQILLGALVAGIDAGRTYTDWPLMAGGFLPLNMWELEPIWRNFFEDPGLVQFNHRMVGYLLLLVGLYVWWRSRRSAHVTTKRAFDWVAVILFGQMVLGIVTVLNAAPWTWAIAHQFGAVVTICLILRARFRARYPVATSLRGAVA